MDHKTGRQESDRLLHMVKEYGLADSDKTPSIACGEFVKRQHKGTRFSYYEGSWGDLEELAMENWSSSRPGYRDGVRLIRVPAAGFRSAVVKVTRKDKIVTKVDSRKAGERDGKYSYALGRPHVKAECVDLVVYRADVLEEDGDRETDADWEIISINASPIGRPVPMRALTMARNERHLAGGTRGEYSKDEYIDSILFWSGHSMADPNATG